MSEPYAAEVLQKLDPARIAKRVAEKEQDIARQEAIVEWVRDQADAEERHLWSMQRGLDDLRTLASAAEAAR